MSPGVYLRSFLLVEKGWWDVNRTTLNESHISLISILLIPNRHPILIKNQVEYGIPYEVSSFLVKDEVCIALERYLFSLNGDQLTL